MGEIYEGKDWRKKKKKVKMKGKEKGRKRLSILYFSNFKFL